MLRVDPSDPTPLYAQLANAIRAAIASGQLQPGDQLATVRQLAVDLRINANTVAKVYNDLERLGVVATRRGIGTFILGLPPESTSRRERERALRVAADRLLTDAAALGSSLDDVIAHFQQRRPRR